MRGRQLFEDDEASVHSSATETVQRTIRKEADKVVLPAFPNRPQLQSWRRGVARALVTASAYTDSAEVAWVSEAFNRSKKFEDFEDSGEERFQSLDQKMAVALHGIMKASENKARLIIDLLTVKEEQLFSRGKLATGRAILWLINEHFQTNSTTDHAYDLMDLTNMEWFGDGITEMNNFRCLWDLAINGMHPRLREETLTDILYKR